MVFLTLTLCLCCVGSYREISGPYNITYSIGLEIGICPVMKLNISGEPRNLDVILRSPSGYTDSVHVVNVSLLDGFEEVELKLDECGRTPKEGAYILTIEDNRSIVSRKVINIGGPKVRIESAEIRDNKLYLKVVNEGDLPAVLKRCTILIDEKRLTWWFIDAVPPRSYKMLEFDVYGKGNVRVMLFSEENKLIAEYRG